MTKIIFGFISLLMISSLFAGQGEIKVSSDRKGAYIYVDGKKKAMTGEGFTSILLESGEYTIKVSKPIDMKYEYTQSKKVFVGEETSVTLGFKLKKQMTAKGKALQAKADADKLVRWQRNSEVVLDTKLGLMWQDDTAVATTKKTWKNAKKYCQNLSLAGHSDWRLPSYDELLTIVDYDRRNPAIMPSFNNVNTVGRYWSSSPYVADEEHAWFVYFYNGHTAYGYKTLKYYICCVRSGN